MACLTMGRAPRLLSFPTQQPRAGYPVALAFDGEGWALPQDAHGRAGAVRRGLRQARNPLGGGV